jgi:hypothetical protein
MTTSHAATTVRHCDQSGPRTALSALLSAEPPVVRVRRWAERGRSYVTAEIGPEGWLP